MMLNKHCPGGAGGTLAAAEFFWERIMPVNEEGAVVNFQNYDPLYSCFIPFIAFLNNSVSSDGCKIFMMLTASIVLLILPMKRLRLGLFCALLQIPG